VLQVLSLEQTQINNIFQFGKVAAIGLERIQDRSEAVEMTKTGTFQGFHIDLANIILVFTCIAIVVVVPAAAKRLLLRAKVVVSSIAAAATTIKARSDLVSSSIAITTTATSIGTTTVTVTVTVVTTTASVTAIVVVSSPPGGSVRSIVVVVVVPIVVVRTRWRCTDGIEIVPAAAANITTTTAAPTVGFGFRRRGIGAAIVGTIGIGTIGTTGTPVVGRTRSGRRRRRTCQRIKAIPTTVVAVILVLFLILGSFPDTATLVVQWRRAVEHRCRCGVHQAALMTRNKGRHYGSFRQQDSQSEHDGSSKSGC
jgi:hypothetical protein